MSEPANTLEQFRQAVAEDLRSLAFLHAAELDGAVIAGLREAGFPAGLGLQLASPSGREALRVMEAAVATLPPSTDTAALDLLAADFADIYLTHGAGASPCESFWLDDDHILCQEPMFQVRACYERHGLAARDWRQMSDDHLVPQLEFIACLMEKGVLDETARFMDEHLLRWLGQFAERLAARGIPFYGPLAFLTWAYCEELRELLAQVLNQPRPGKEEVEARLRPSKSAVQEMPLQYMPGVTPSW
jgi:TorA maturation chaperone TorD